MWKAGTLRAGGDVNDEPKLGSTDLALRSDDKSDTNADALQLDLRRPEPGAKAVEIRRAPVDPFSDQWAGIVRPFALWIFGLILVVTAVPFVAIMFVSSDSKWGTTERIEALLRWATTVLPPIVGFGSAAVAYYFGSRRVGHESGAEPASAESGRRAD